MSANLYYIRENSREIIYYKKPKTVNEVPEIIIIGGTFDPATPINPKFCMLFLYLTANERESVLYSRKFAVNYLRKFA